MGSLLAPHCWQTACSINSPPNTVWPMHFPPSRVGHDGDHSAWIRSKIASSVSLASAMPPTRNWSDTCDMTARTGSAETTCSSPNSIWLNMLLNARRTLWGLSAGSAAAAAGAAADPSMSLPRLDPSPSVSRGCGYDGATGNGGAGPGGGGGGRSSISSVCPAM